MLNTRTENKAHAFYVFHLKYFLLFSCYWHILHIYIYIVYFDIPKLRIRWWHDYDLSEFTVIMWTGDTAWSFTCKCNHACKALMFLAPPPVVLSAVLWDDVQYAQMQCCVQLSGTDFTQKNIYNLGYDYILIKPAEPSVFFFNNTNHNFLNASLTSKIISNTSLKLI